MLENAAFEHLPEHCGLICETYSGTFILYENCAIFQSGL